MNILHLPQTSRLALWWDGLNLRTYPHLMSTLSCGLIMFGFWVMAPSLWRVFAGYFVVFCGCELVKYMRT